MPPFVPRVLLGVLALLALAAPASATTFHIASCGSDVQAALDSATHDGDVVDFASGLDCTLPSSGPYFVQPSASITIEGLGSGATLHGYNGTTRIFTGADIKSTTFRNLTVRDGAPASGNGGLILVTGNSTPTFDHMT